MASHWGNAREVRTAGAEMPTALLRRHGAPHGHCGHNAVHQRASFFGLSAGSRESWVAISLNRHLSLVADRLP